MLTKDKIRNMWRNYKSNYRHFICTALTLFFLLFSIFYFKYAIPRFLECFRNAWTTGKFYFSKLFNLDLSGEITVIQFTKQPFRLPFGIPVTWEDFSEKISKYFTVFISQENFIGYITLLGNILLIITNVIMIVAPIAAAIIIYNLIRKKKSNNDYNVDSKALKRFKNFENKYVWPLKKWLNEFIIFLRENNYYLKICLVIFLFQFNFFSIIFDTFNYYIYFVSSFDRVSIYQEVIRLLMDLSVVIDFFPLPIWILIGYLVLCLIRKNIGLKKINAQERIDRALINERPIVLLLCGTMGSKKTTVITDMALSTEIMFRDKAFELIQKNDLKFPNFPWIVFENELKVAIAKHKIYNLATAKKWCASKEKKFRKNSTKENIFDYDYIKYGMTYDDNLSVQDIWEVLSNYARLYFIYLIQSSLIISNYSIRSDNELLDLGNFPIWDTDLFQRPSVQGDNKTCSHILDFDALRLGKKVIEENQLSDFFEFGIINITEIGKERGNSLENLSLKKNDTSANQKNDLFNSWLKMVRHSATVDNYPFVKVISDEQRPESWGSDARDLSDVLYSDTCSEQKLAMPLFALEDLVMTFFIDRFFDKYYQYRFERGDNTLPMYLYHRFIGFLFRIRTRIYNQFGYYELKLSIEKGTLKDEAEVKKSPYYLMFKKIYSKRFSTDCFSEFFNEKALRSKLGLNDIQSFKSEKATFSEMLKENSYFFNELARIKSNEEEKKKGGKLPPMGGGFPGMPR